MADYLRMYMDGSSARKLGSGWREVLLLDQQGVWVDLLSIPTVTKVRVHQESLRKSKILDVSPSTVSRRLREAVKLRKRCELPWDQKAYRRAMVLLGNEEPPEEVLTKAPDVVDASVIKVLTKNPHKRGSKAAERFKLVAASDTVAIAKAAGVKMRFITRYVRSGHIKLLPPNDTTPPKRKRLKKEVEIGE